MIIFRNGHLLITQKTWRIDWRWPRKKPLIIITLDRWV